MARVLAQSSHRPPRVKQSASASAILAQLGDGIIGKPLYRGLPSSRDATFFSETSFAGPQDRALESRMAQGFVYILINPAIPGYIKVGKTTKTPEERAKEISAATGVPTPFIVAYDASFVDCDQAETYIHTLLETRGISRTPDREFFATSLREAIAVVMEAERNLRHDPNVRGSGTPSARSTGSSPVLPSPARLRGLAEILGKGGDDRLWGRFGPTPLVGYMWS